MLDKPAIQHATIDDVLAAITDLTDQVRALCGLVEQAIGAIPIDDDEMCVGPVAALVRRTPETVRTWCSEHGVGVYDDDRRRYVISRKKLRAYLIERFGRAPDGV